MTRIEDYALIGDCETAALVSKRGSIDWLCAPRFDSPACFAALLGDERHGRWLLAPSCEVREVRRAYREGTLILETTFHTTDGVVTVVDLMSIGSGAPEVVRIVEGREGEVPMRMELVIRFDYGSIVPWVRRSDEGIRAVGGPDSLQLFCDVDVRGEDLKSVSDFVARAGERRAFRLAYAPTFGPAPGPRSPMTRLADTEAFWRDWSSRCTYRGPWREAVVRSLITLKALTFAPTGGIVAAATTSLPEDLGGVRNWDYRYCWLRDATFTLYALLVGGYTDEAAAWREWLVNAAAGSPEQLHIMYGVAGERRLPELDLPWLPGYEGSRPVRIGNDAHRQHQLDVSGEIMDALHLARRLGLPPSENAWRVQRAILRFLEEDWREPDEGIWEMRGGRRHFTHSKVMAWVAADRAVKAVEQHGVDGEVARWRRLRDEIHAEVCREGFDERLGSFVQHYGSDEPDASLLMIPEVGFLPASDRRVVGTVRLIEERLVEDGFVHRYRATSDVDGLPGDEGAFLLCTFWLADNLALQGRTDEALAIFERLLSLRNDVGLLAEEYDVASERMVGNFPQAFSHVGLINTARNLAAAGGPAEHRQRPNGASDDEELSSPSARRSARRGTPGTRESARRRPRA